MNVKQEIKSAYTLLSISGTIDINNIHHFKEELMKNAESSLSHIVIDTSQLDNMEASGIGAFIALQKKMILANKEVAFVNIQPNLLQALEAAGIQNFFNIYTDESQLPWQ